ncbi:MAG: hypothetical protein JW798_17515 [Prolixibacteraceae bacterium]|nr:hypothetical protein [Prolixibacteraceae bacterium]
MTEKKGPKIPLEKQIEFINQYQNVFEIYNEFAEVLDSILTRAVRELGIMAIVQTRAKKVDSFATKIIKKDKYTDPLNDMTDLCGGRVIVQFQSQVQNACNFIRENFEIDEANSLDAKSRLLVGEFGYRSIHYIVSPLKTKILGIDIDQKFFDKDEPKLKAEIQVRTLAEHIWADIAHDRVYKTNLNIPDEWNRRAARLSAILEDADNDFGEMGKEIDSINRMYEIQLKSSNKDKEENKLKSFLKIFSDKPTERFKFAIDLANIYKAEDKFEAALNLLEDEIRNDLNENCINPIQKIQALFNIGIVKLQLSHSKNNSSLTDNKEIIDCFNEIENLQKNASTEQYLEEISLIHYQFGKFLQAFEHESDKAHEHLCEANNRFPDNPLYFVALLESMVTRNNELAAYSINLFKAGIDKAINNLSFLLNLGIKKLPALFALGHCYFFMNDEYNCFNSYCNAVDVFLSGRDVCGCMDIKNEIALINRLNFYNRELTQKIKILLHLALYLKGTDGKNSSLEYLQSIALYKKPFRKQIVVVAGGASDFDEKSPNLYATYISELLHDFEGSIISGGTKNGIPGLLGEKSLELKTKGNSYFETIAYIPSALPEAISLSEGYDNFCKTNSGRFSILEALLYWTDIIIQDITPANVFILGINGGKISELEYKLALALGGKVGLIKNSGRKADQLFDDPFWGSHPKLIQIPRDPYTVWAILNQNTGTILTTSEIDELAQKAHELYREKRILSLKPDEKDINKYKVIVRWEKLDPALQHSNRMQVAFYELILKRVGLSIRKAEKPNTFNIKENVSESTYNLMARLEHGRWNAERLLEGWKYGPRKDLNKKTSPCLVSWNELDEETKTYDFDPIDKIPEMLRLINYEVVK